MLVRTRYNKTMLIIGHRGAAGLAAENTLEALQVGIDADVDMLEFDVRLTSDKVPILAHDSKLHGHRISQTRYSKLRKAGPVTTLRNVLDKLFGQIYLNLEFKPVNGVDVVFDLIKKNYIKKPDDWNSLLVSSFHASVLVRLRRRSRNINLSLLHSINPFSFMIYNRTLHLSAAGWHRLHYNKLSIQLARKMDIFTYVYTVNRPQTALLFSRRKVDGVVTDFPDRISRALNKKNK